MRPFGIHVFVISPGNVRTALTEAIVNSPEASRWLPQFRTLQPVEWHQPDEAADLVLFLASGAADALSGRFLHVQDDARDLVRRSGEVRERDLLVLRLTRDSGA